MSYFSTIRKSHLTYAPLIYLQTIIVTLIFSSCFSVASGNTPQEPQPKLEAKVPFRDVPPHVFSQDFFQAYLRQAIDYLNHQPATKSVKTIQRPAFTSNDLGLVNAENASKLNGTAIMQPRAVAALVPFGSCPDQGFLIEGKPTKISYIDPTDGSTYPLVTLPDEANAAAFNPIDGFLYMRATNTPNVGNADLTIYKVGADGNYVEYGIKNITYPQAGNVGEIDGNGFLHFTGAGGGNTVVVIDLNPTNPTLDSVKVVRTYTHSGALGLDMTYNPSDGLFYSLKTNTGEIVTMNPQTGAMAVVGTVTTGLEAGQWGAQFRTSDNKLLAINNTTGNLYSFDLSNLSSTMTATYIGQTGKPGQDNNDGAGCPQVTPCVTTITDDIAPVCIDNARWLVTFNTSGNATSTVTASPAAAQGPTHGPRDQDGKTSWWAIFDNSVTSVTISVTENGCTKDRVYRRPADCSTTAPLPLKILSFVGEAADEGINLQWLVSEEELVNKFDIMRSQDAVNFVKVGEVSSVNDWSYHTYNYLDNTAKYGIDYYYQLKAYDSDGSITESAIIAVKKAGNSLVVYPNPINADGSFYVHLNESGDIAGATLSSISGFNQNMAFQKVSEGFYAFQTNGLLPGIYILRVKLASGEVMDVKVVR